MTNKVGMIVVTITATIFFSANPPMVSEARQEKEINLMKLSSLSKENIKLLDSTNTIKLHLEYFRLINDAKLLELELQQIKLNTK
jgi:hypothetical protein